MKKTDPQCKKRLKTTSEICVLFRHRPQNLKETSKTCNLQAQKKKKHLKPSHSFSTEASLRKAGAESLARTQPCPGGGPRGQAGWNEYGKQRNESPSACRGKVLQLGRAETETILFNHSANSSANTGDHK